MTSVIEVQVGIDGLALAQARTAKPIALSRRDLYLALAETLPNGRKNSYKTWREVNPKLPATRIEVIGPPPTSGTRDSFNELIIEPGCNTFPAMAALKKTDEGRHKSACTRIREDGVYVEAGENDNLIVQKLVANPNAVGAFGYSYLEENLDKLKDVPLGGVPATYETISSFKYPASRAMFIYAKGAHMWAVKGMPAFLAEYVKETTFGPKGYLARRGLVASPPALRQRQRAIVQKLVPLDLASIK